MAGSSLLALIDDIASILDDVSTMTKVAAKKTAGVLGDDLALNAQQVAGVRADRELPVILKVARGSILNKAILIPAALLISAILPKAITPLLMLGGLYLCFEGFEKLAHRFLSGHDSVSDHKPVPEKSEQVLSEKEKIQGAVRTDFILSAEIIVISLGSVAEVSLWLRTVVLVLIGIIITVGVYGLVAGIVKLDDLGLFLQRRPGKGRIAGLQHLIGRFLLRAAPWLMKALSVVGTVAMFMVGGSILLHGITPVGHLIESAQELIMATSVAGGLLAGLLAILVEILLGVMSGVLVFMGVACGKKLVGRIRKRA